MEKQQFGLAWVAGTSYLAVGVFQGFFSRALWFSLLLKSNISRLESDQDRGLA